MFKDALNTATENVPSVKIAFTFQSTANVKRKSQDASTKTESAASATAHSSTTPEAKPARSKVVEPTASMAVKNAIQVSKSAETTLAPCPTASR